MLVVFQSYELKENSSPMKEGMVQTEHERGDEEFRGLGLQRKAKVGGGAAAV